MGECWWGPPSQGHRPVVGVGEWCRCGFAPKCLNILEGQDVKELVPVVKTDERFKRNEKSKKK